MKSLISALKTHPILVSDGAWGTFLQNMGLGAGECPESWNLSHPNEVRSIARSYMDAGADIVLTNSFGGSRFKLAHYGLAMQTVAVNQAAAGLSREAAGDDHFVLGSIGPSGKMLMMGDVTEEEWIEGFGEQAAALIGGGADAVCIETMSALDEAVCAIQGTRKYTQCEIVCTFTFEKTQQGDFRTMMGVSPEEMALAVRDAGADIIGTNCGNGMERMIEIVTALRKTVPELPVLVHANAGMPHITDGKTVFPEGPADTARWIPALIDAGACIIGGCCGTTPDHIRAIAQAVKNR